MAARSIGKLGESLTVDGEMHSTSYAQDSGEEVEVTIETFEELPVFPPEGSAKRAKCIECIGKGVMSELRSDFLTGGMHIPESDEDLIVRTRVECDGRTMLRSHICRVALAQYDRDGAQLTVMQPKYDVGK